MSKKKEFEYEIRIEDVIDGKPVNRRTFKAKEEKINGVWYLVNIDEGTQDQFDKVLFPRKRIIKEESKYKTVEDVEKRIDKVLEILEGEEYLQDPNKNEIDYENELYELDLVRKKKIFEKYGGNESFLKGENILEFIRQGNFLIPKAYDYKLGIEYVPSDVQYQFHTTRQQEIDRDFPSKPNKKFLTLNNFLTLILLLLIGLSIFIYFDLQNEKQEIKIPLIECQQARNEDTTKYGDYLKNLVTETKNNLDQQEKIISSSQPTSNQNADTPPKIN